MAKMSYFEGREIVDKAAREEIAALKNNAGSGSGDGSGSGVGAEKLAEIEKNISDIVKNISTIEQRHEADRMVLSTNIQSLENKSVMVRGDANANANQVTTPGVYKVSSSSVTNYPLSSHDGGILIVCTPLNTSDVVVQMYVNSNDLVTYIRVCWYGNWRSWRDYDSDKVLLVKSFDASTGTLVTQSGDYTG